MDLRQKYESILKNEQNDIDGFVEKLQELIFDYFNMIKKEYYLTLDKQSSDLDYVKCVKEVYSKIDKEMYDEEVSQPTPEGLTKEIAN